MLFVPFPPAPKHANTQTHTRLYKHSHTYKTVIICQQFPLTNKSTGKGNCGLNVKFTFSEFSALCRIMHRKRFVLFNVSNYKVCVTKTFHFMCSTELQTMRVNNFVKLYFYLRDVAVFLYSRSSQYILAHGTVKMLQNVLRNCYLSTES